MRLWKIVSKEYRYIMLWLITITSISAAASIGVIAFINDSLTAFSNEPLRIVFQLVGLLILLFALNMIAQYSMSYVGQKFVYDLRNRFVKRVINTDIATIDKTGSSRIIASLSKDIDSIQDGFLCVTEVVQGLFICIAVSIYLSYLSIALYFVVLVMMVIMIVVGNLLIKRIYSYYKKRREEEDGVYKVIETIINGRKELSLNRHRAKQLYYKEYEPHADAIRNYIVRADMFYFTSLNWTDTIMLGTIGIVFYLAAVLGWADVATATTFAITILFLKGPLMQMVGCYPALTAAQVGFSKMEALTLSETEADFNDADTLQTQQPPSQQLNNQPSYQSNHQSSHQSSQSWQTLNLNGITYNHLDKDSQPSFGIGPIDLTIQRGEVFFLIGGNGSGKTTLAKVLTGLYRPKSGQISFDSNVVNASVVNNDNHNDGYLAYRQNFSAIYSDAHLFKTLVGKEDELTKDDKALIEEWLDILQMRGKLDIDEDGKILNEDLSQGQKKRLAMILAVLEQRDLILLDEWAADQDPQFRRTFYQEIIPKLKAMGKTLIVISHDDHYFEHADRLFQMQNGQLIELMGQARLDASRDAIAQIT